MENRPKILVADDEPQVVEYLTQVLESEGYSTRGIADSAQVVGIVRELNPALLILDLNMPAPDGFEIMKALRATHPGLMILGISGYAQGALLAAASFLGANATIAKPMSNEDLIEKVKAMIGPAQDAPGPAEDPADVAPGSNS